MDAHKNNIKFRKEYFFMTDLTRIELQRIKQIVLENENKYQKVNFYLTQIKDVQIQQLLNNIAQDSLNAKQQFISFLNS